MKSKNIKIESLTKFTIMLLLENGPVHGYEIIKYVSSRTGKRLSPSQVYPFLRQLEARGYVSRDSSGTRQRTDYKLTANGKDFVSGLNSKFGEIIDVYMHSRLFTCAHCGCEIYKGGVTRTIKGKKLTFCCESCAKAYIYENGQG